MSFAAVVVVALTGATTACDNSHANAKPARAQVGTALRAHGPQLGGVIGVQTADLGAARRYGFAWPQLTNSSRTTVTIDSVALQKVPRTAAVVTYRALSVTETPGYLVSSDIGEANVSNYARYPNHLHDPIMIAPGKRSPIYPVVYVKNVGPGSSKLYGCLVRYRQGGHLFQQAFHCEFDLGG